jgi:hypothetical protein
MARNETWNNQDGLDIGFGTRDSFNSEDTEVHTLGRVKQAEIQFNAGNAADLYTGVVPSGKEFILPAGSAVLSAVLVVETAFVVTTSISMGRRDATTGLTIDDNSLVTVVEGVAANLTPDGVTVIGAGADVGGPVIAADSIIELVQNGGDAAVGELRLLVEYIEAVPSQVTPAIIVGEI